MHSGSLALCRDLFIVLTSGHTSLVHYKLVCLLSYVN